MNDGFSRLAAISFSLLLAVVAFPGEAEAQACQDFVFCGLLADPGGLDLCDPFTDPGLIAGVQQCSEQNGDAYWCCNGSDCECFCDQADADAFCGGLGQATCDTLPSYEFILDELRNIPLLCDGGISVRTEDVDLADADALKDWVVDEGEVSSASDLEKIAIGNLGGPPLSQASFFYQGFQLWYELAVGNGDSQAVARFESADEILGRLFAALKSVGKHNAVQRTEFDGGQSDRLYFYDSDAQKLIILTMSCG